MYSEAWSTIGPHSVFYEVPSAALGGQVTKFIHIINSILQDTFVEKEELRWPKRKLDSITRTFIHSGYAQYATRVTLWQSDQPSGNMAESQNIF